MPPRSQQLRESMVFLATPNITTVFEPASGRPLLQNPASVAYYGERTLAGGAGAGGAALLTQPGQQEAGADVLAEVFALEPQKLEQLLSALGLYEEEDEQAEGGEHEEDGDGEEQGHRDDEHGADASTHGGRRGGSRRGRRRGARERQAAELSAAATAVWKGARLVCMKMFLT